MLVRVILVNKFHYRKGGSETYYFDVAEGLRQRGHEVHFFAMEGPDNELCEDSDLFVSSKDYNGPSGVADKAKAALSLIYSNEAKGRFQLLCERVRPDVVHMNLVHRQITLSILDAPYLKEHNVPVLFTSHDYILVCPSYVMLDGAGEVCDACLGGKFSNCLKRRCVKGSTAKSGMALMEAEFLKATHAYRKIDRVIAPSEFMRSKLVEGGFPADQVVLMQNFAKDTVLASARDAQDRTDWDNPYLLFFGRLSREKGVDVLVDAFLAAIPSLPGNLRLVIAGDGPERGAIEERLAAADPADAERVELVGFQAGEDMRRYAERASLAIASSRWRENMPYSIVEAFALGTPVAGTDIGGIPELVMEGETGFVCQPGDADSLSEAIIRGVAACADREAYARMQGNCRNYVLTRCDQSAYMDRLIALYQELIDTKREAVAHA